MKKILLLIFITSYGFLTHAQQTDKKLQKQLQQLVQGYHGDIGIYVKSLKTGKTVTFNADTLFPTASIVKVPILLGVMDKIRSGELAYDSEMVYKDSLFYSGSDILGSFKANEKIALKKLILLMLSTSDNTASLWLQGLAGGGQRINTILDSLGFKQTRVNSRTPGREDNRTNYGWGQTTPREMGTIFERIYSNAVFNPDLCERMMRCLGRNYWDENEAIGMIPPTVEVFSKNGCVNASRNEVLLVNGHREPYLFCIFTKNNQDQRWEHDNEAWKMARDLSAFLWKYYK